VRSDLTKTAYDALLEMCDEAIDLAETAITKASYAEDSLVVKVAAPQITLTKVASARYLNVAVALKKTGSFPDKTEEYLAKHLKDGGELALLEIMEKLASRAVFDAGSEIDLGGSLVEKSATSRDHSQLSGSTAMWRRALDEADAEIAGQT